MNDAEYERALYQAIAQAPDPQAFQQALAALERWIDAKVRRQRSVPDAERR